MQRWKQIAIWTVTAPVALWIGWNLGDVFKCAPQVRACPTHFVAETNDPNIVAIYDPDTDKWRWARLLGGPPSQPAPEPEDASR